MVNQMEMGYRCTTTLVVIKYKRIHSLINIDSVTGSQINDHFQSSTSNNWITQNWNKSKRDRYCDWIGIIEVLLTVDGTKWHQIHCKYHCGQNTVRIPEKYKFNWSFIYYLLISKLFQFPPLRIKTYEYTHCQIIK